MQGSDIEVGSHNNADLVNTTGNKTLSLLLQFHSGNKLNMIRFYLKQETNKRIHFYDVFMGACLKK